MENVWNLLKVITSKERSLCEQYNNMISLDKIKNVIRFVCPLDEKVVFVKGKKIIRQNVIYKGYLYFESKNELTGDELKNISMLPGVSSFMKSKIPVKLNKSDVSKIIKDDKLESHIIKNSSTIYKLDNVLIIDGPFKDFKGVVDKINNDNADVIVKLFEVETKINLSLKQLSKIYENS
jgi:transcriptional antiterminator NusG